MNDDSLYNQLMNAYQTNNYGVPATPANGGLMDYFNADNLGGTLKGIGGIASGLYGMYLGNQQLDMMRENLAMNKDKWKEQKQELNHLRGTRKRLSAAYMA